MQFSLVSLVAALATTTSAIYIPRQVNGTVVAYPTLTPSPVSTLNLAVPTSSAVAPPIISLGSAASTASIRPTSIAAPYPTGTGAPKPSFLATGTGAPSKPTTLPPFTGGAPAPTHMAGSALGLLVAGGVALMF